MKIIKADFGIEKQYLSDVIKELPSNCLFDKGITGCGGTTLEINSKRNSLILVPTINLVINKTENNPNLLGVYGKVSKFDVESYIQTAKIKKIIATYDSFTKLIDWIGDSIYSYFLLVDEYHILFNQYSFRFSAIKNILTNFNKFKKFCFLTATPLKEENILSELRGLERYKVEWTNSTPVKINLKNVYFTSKEIVKEIENIGDYNLHIFINSINTIRSVISQIPSDISFRTVCSRQVAQKDIRLGGKLKIASINSPVKRVNFYTATAFEGVDIYDPKGKTVIVSDTNISQSLIDISTLFVQICGRLRDSIYKDDITFICNTSKHRYLRFNNDEEFNTYSEQVKSDAIEYQSDFEKRSKHAKSIDFNGYLDNPEYWHNLYISGINDSLTYDPNLKSLDKQNYTIVSKVFYSEFSVLKQLQQEKIVEKVTVPFEEYKRALAEILPNFTCDANTLEHDIFPKLNIKNWMYFNIYFENSYDKRIIRRAGQRISIYDFTRLKLILNK